MWAINIYAEVVKKLARLPAGERERILRAIYAMRENPFTKDLIPLRDRPGWRLRVGRWRILLTIDKDTRTINVLSLGPRGDVYK